MIKGRYTPWDETSLKLKTFEILEVDKSDVAGLKHALVNNTFCDADLIYGRFASSDLFLKDLFLKSGYFPCETSFKIVLRNLNEYQLPKIYLRRLLDLSEPTEYDFFKIAEIAKSMFKFSRFHEDPFVSNELADCRMFRWVNDLVKSDVEFIISKLANGDVASFMIYQKVSPEHVELILGGSAKGYEMHSPFFWGSILNNLKIMGVNKVTTRISAANSGVLSLYQNLGFKIAETDTDYHKHKSLSFFSKNYS